MTRALSLKNLLRDGTLRNRPMGFYERLNGDGVVHLRLVDDGSFVGDGVDGDRGVDASFVDG